MRERGFSSFFITGLFRLLLGKWGQATSEKGVEDPSLLARKERGLLPFLAKPLSLLYHFLQGCFQLQSDRLPLGERRSNKRNEKMRRARPPLSPPPLPHSLSPHTPYFFCRLARVCGVHKLLPDVQHSDGGGGGGGGGGAAAENGGGGGAANRGAAAANAAAATAASNKAKSITNGSAITVTANPQQQQQQQQTKVTVVANNSGNGADASSANLNGGVKAALKISLPSSQDKEEEDEGEGEEVREKQLPLATVQYSTHMKLKRCKPIIQFTPRHSFT